ncbi:hypothetical protein MMC09_005600 [Bachmanniomyces sp. S44760]|nr:hypothetical protein [Bachmanniomyces sp. S44760]
MAGKTAKSMKLGSNIVVGGLVVQILFFGFFMLATFIFHFRIKRHPTALSTSSAVPWKKHWNVLYAASTLILVRSVFRVIEYAQGNAGFLLSHEYFLYVFDSVLMLGVVVLLNVVHPSEISALLRAGGGQDHEMKLDTMGRATPFQSESESKGEVMGRV